ncbi:MAG: UDP-N-acetylmuramate dehydrogenase [Limnospira sp. PMC 1291.21]|uniref:UDP-N-acetylenolpyruvoylglucosamine reductase n=1 Tax=Limnospira indica PCC 8005 TaxID=376219 RepID=A0A9P1KFV6_9CYAN|nr:MULTISPECIES: UDP-N-acetylmuramate dehydrogenase [Limnospira]EKD06619.1 UDP-N-acetylenolpyruvylglucosamine reductase [Arthrospira platensis C1]QJB26524.1 UDP-N-acetylmuramate dehydrogenase [Limnospira fusiformis SAG 85.79]MDT9179924.1 UDP-N-acetylmuramate dehydrogenase [Limnospira sp. PMC 1238.20]MDT9195186.1 UDP-N-acetylmuramate dehydrogenase [Limnospira sp. PMC 1245.20]MDT9200421.1 UDP-N-acetylmuramate dehydrogenase [Limnospira sp. PMC 1042.18]
MVMTVSSGSLGQVNGKPERSITLLGNDCLIRSKVSLASLTSFRVGGPADWYTAPQRLDQLLACLEWANAEELPITLLGGGSNLLVSDRGLRGLVIGTRYLRHTHFDQETGQLTVGSGASLPRLAWKAARMGWRGLEWAVGIPGTVGGAIVMNAGAHISCTADILVNTHILERSGTLQVLPPEKLGYRYRTSNLQGSDRLVTQATFQLQPGYDPEQVMAETTEHFQQRRLSQPYHLPSCGSVFRNPGPHKAGWLIEQTGLKGYKIGGAQVAERHANFILNCGSATASDIFQLIHHVQERVQHQWSCLLEPEVRILGEHDLISN